MQSTACRGCRRPFLDVNGGKNIFDDGLLIKSLDSNDPYNKKWHMKLYSGIELITGQKVIKDEKLPQKLCDVCFQNVEAYINFRFQLLRSRDILLSASYQDKVVIDTKSFENKHLPLLNTVISKVDINTATKKLPEFNLIQNEFCSSPLISNERVINNFVSKTISEDLINVDESSTSLDLNDLHNEDGETNDSLSSKLQNDQDNNNLIDSDNSIDHVIIANEEEIDVKLFDHDIESEIDVCSGEDDDVLELDIQKLKNETVEIPSSSESDIEVCDYEPTGKRGNYNNTLSKTTTF